VVSFPLAFPPIIYTRSSSPHSCYMARLSNSNSKYELSSAFRLTTGWSRWVLSTHPQLSWYPLCSKFCFCFRYLYQNCIVCLSAVRAACPFISSSLQPRIHIIELLVILVLYDAVNRNKLSIHQLPLISFFTHYMFRPLRAIFRWDIQLDIWRTILIQRIRCTYGIWL
jgi:hypothetical protein